MKNFSIEFINSVNGIDPESLTEDEIEAQEQWIIENEDETEDRP